MDEDISYAKINNSGIRDKQKDCYVQVLQVTPTSTKLHNRCSVRFITIIYIFSNSIDNFDHELKNEKKSFALYTNDGSQFKFIDNLLHMN